MTNNEEQTMTPEEQTNEARYLGYDAGLSQATGSVLSELGARAIIAGDDDVWSDMLVPNLSGEWSGDPVPNDIARECGLDPYDENDSDAINEACDTWEEYASRGFRDALTAMAYRLVGPFDTALQLEARYEAKAARYRRATLR